MVARTNQVGDREDFGRVSRGDGHRACRTLEGRDACRDGVGGRVGQASVHVARLGERELRGAVCGVVELKGGRRVDGERRGAGRGVRRKAGMNLERVEVGAGILGKGGVEFECHVFLLLYY